MLAILTVFEGVLCPTDESAREKEGQASQQGTAAGLTAHWWLRDSRRNLMWKQGGTRDENVFRRKDARSKCNIIRYAFKIFASLWWYDKFMISSVNKQWWWP